MAGRETREQVRRHMREAKEHFHELAEKATKAMGRAVDAGREVIQETQSVLAGAFAAGRAGRRRERERLSGESNG